MSWMTSQLLSFAIKLSVLTNLVPYICALVAPPAVRPPKGCPVGMVWGFPPPYPYAVAVLLPLAELPVIGTFEVLPEKV
ncbi:hypothetical protein BDR03DRAFT_639213 [Suillus americanus]|nr:hypothetical protein BDR03DRAFT_639213 [Suillus americanus]